MNLAGIVHFAIQIRKQRRLARQDTISAAECHHGPR
jgi:hypothetical protein